MNKKRELTNTILNKNPVMNYLSDDECYYLDRKKEKLNLAIIGCGMIGMEHIQVAAL